MTSDGDTLEPVERSVIDEALWLVESVGEDAMFSLSLTVPQALALVVWDLEQQVQHLNARLKELE